MLLVKVCEKKGVQYYLISDDYCFKNIDGVDSLNNDTILHLFKTITSQELMRIDEWCESYRHTYEILTTHFDTLGEFQQKYPEYFY